MVIDPEWKAVRSVHLQGGCRAFNGLNNSVELQPRASNGKIAAIVTPTYHGLFPILAQAGFSVIGADFYFDRDQTDGRRLPEWRAYNALPGSLWPTIDQADQFSFIAHAAIKDKNGELWDIARRITYLLRTCNWRVRQISDAYHQQLMAYVKANSFTAGNRRNDEFTWLGYLAIQSFLVDACTLRDYLAEYRALIMSQAGTIPAKPRITKMASLVSRYLSVNPSLTPVDRHLSDATAVGGWLHEIGSLRDLAVHVAPLADADKRLYALCKSVPIDAQETLPSIKLPIPAEPSKIAASRHSGAHFDDPQLNFARFSNALENPDVALDGLEYAHWSLGRLASLASELSAISPVAPEMPSLTAADIIDLKITNGRST
jgi:hypothetical protein